MSRYRIETVHGRHLLCGGLIPNNLVQVGQVWAPADGNDYEVRVKEIGDEGVVYTWGFNGTQTTHRKEIFSFQCRYCLVLDTAEIPKELQ